MTVRKFYALTGSFGIIGFVSYFWVAGVRSAMAFAVGALCSFGNLWVFDRISKQLAPGENSRKPLQAGAYFIRYILLLGIGYAIVKALRVSPLAVILGLLASTAAVLVASVIELLTALKTKSS
ncbi:MAG: ATP synthase subunit I [Acidobacteriota bacterium]|nr:ATP synthase subunit I [Acidobacteriota bacterium]